MSNATNNPSHSPSSAPSRGAFGSRLGFILAAAGSAIGLGNIWRFPYTAGEGGGGAFVLVYLVFVFAIGVPVLLAELSLGRATGRNPVGAFASLTNGSAWRFVGGLGVVTGFGILAFYSVVAGWTLSYFGRAVMGAFEADMTSEQSAAMFESIIGSPLETILVAGLFIVLTAVIVRAGVGGGIERAAKILMPAFFVLLVILAVRSVTLPGGWAGVEFLFAPDFAKLTPKVVMSALGQALFSLSLGMGAMLTYGSYMAKHEKLASAGVAVAFFDTLIAIVGGLVIFPALFASGLDPAAGPGLVFVVLPTIFDTLPAGNLFAIAFYALLAIAALTSTLSLLEVIVSYFVDERGWKREAAVWAMSALCFSLAVPSALSQGAAHWLTDFALGKSFLDWQSILFGNYALTLGALLTSLFIGWRWGTAQALTEMHDLRGARLWAILIRWVCPVAILLILGFIFVTGETF